MPEAVFLTCPELWAQGHGSGHPLKPERLERTDALLRELGCLQAPNVTEREPRFPDEAELALFHSLEYIAAVRALSRGDATIPAGRFNFGPGDNPVFPGMYQSEGLKVGSALTGAEMLVEGECEVAFSYGGGLHHAGPDRASGFCVFNDAAVAIHWLLRRGLRVAYVDVDVHHGDGVQDAFYDTDRVLTISLHQSGRTLFPGTGFVEETGRGQGRGFCANLPLPPGADDDIYLWAFERVVPPLVTRFAPDILVTQCGVDTHYLDPLARLALTTRGHYAIFQRLHAFSLPWLALGGGGYNLDVVPRSWALAFGVMSGRALPEELPQGYRARFGGRWLRDQGGPAIPEEKRAGIRHRVEANVASFEEIHQIK
jgi:acetoin utilization protein AcuC